MKAKKNRSKHQESEKLKIPSLFMVIYFGLVIPLVFSKATLDPVLYPRFTLVFAGLLILISLFLIYDKQVIARTLSLFRKPVFITFGVFIVISVISLIYAANPAEGLTDIFKWLLMMSLFLIATMLFNTYQPSRKLFLKVLIIVSLIGVIIGFYQYLNDALNNSDPNALYEVKGLMAHKNQYAIFFFLQLPFLAISILKLEGNWKRLAVASLSLNMIMIFILQTRAVWLAIFFSILITLLLFLIVSQKNRELKINLKIRKITIGLILGFTLLPLTIVFVKPDIYPLNVVTDRLETIFDPDYASNQWRFEMWNATNELIADHPFTGVGAGNWKINIYPYYGKFLPSVYKHWRNPHNDYLWVLSEKGIAGLLTYLLIYLFVIYSAITMLFHVKEKTAAFELLFLLFGITGFLVVSFFSFPTERVYHLVMLAFIFAYVYSMTQNIDGNKKQMQKRTLRFLAVLWIVIVYGGFHFGIIAINSEVNIYKAQTAKDKNNWREVKKYAEKGYNSLSPIEPKFSFPVVMYKGLAAFHQDKNYTEALTYFMEAQEDHPTQVAIMNNIGSTYAQTGNFQKAIEYYKKTLSVFSHYEFGLLNISKAYYKLGNYPLAYQYVLKCDPESTNREVKFVRDLIEKEME